jgi:hypothetical protein
MPSSAGPVPEMRLALTIAISPMHTEREHKKRNESGPCVGDLGHEALRVSSIQRLHGLVVAAHPPGKLGDWTHLHALAPSTEMSEWRALWGVTAGRAEALSIGARP